MRKLFLPLFVLLAGIASAGTHVVPHVLESNGKILGLVFNVTGGQMVFDPATGAFERRPLTMLCGESFDVLNNLLPKNAEFAQVDVDKEVWRQDFGQVKADRHDVRMAKPRTRSVTLPGSNPDSLEAASIKVEIGAAAYDVRASSPRPTIRTKEGLYVLDSTSITVNGQPLPDASVSPIRLSTKEDEDRVRALDGNPTLRMSPGVFTPRMPPGGIVSFGVSYKGKNGTILEFKGTAMVVSNEPEDIFEPFDSDLRVELRLHHDWRLVVLPAESK